MVHVSISTKNEIDEIKKNKRTTIIRGYNSRRLPHSRIFIGDEIYFLEKGAHESNLKAYVKSAESISLLSKDEIELFFNKINKTISLTEDELTKYKKKCIVIIELENVNTIEKINIPKYRLTEDWLMDYTLQDIQNR